MPVTVYDRFLLRPFPALYLFFKCDSLIYIVIAFLKNQSQWAPFECVGLWIEAILMLVHPSIYIICDARVVRTVTTA